MSGKPSSEHQKEEDPALQKSATDGAGTEARAAQEVTSNVTQRGTGSKRCAIGGAGVVVIIIVVIIAILLSGRREDYDDDYVPLGVDFITGVSLITSYSINTTISQRLARTVITMDVANALDCTSVHGITLQLPLSARVASLQTVADDGCHTTGELKELEDARETFMETAASGLPAAYVEARDSTTYSIQVSLPPTGNTVVELTVEELLGQKVGAVEFQVPFVPNEKVDQVSIDIQILGVAGAGAGGGNATTPATGSSFDLDFGADFDTGTLTSPYSLHIPDAREYELLPVLRGSFIPETLPDEGVLRVEDQCFEHVFRPSNLEQKPKNLFFVVDVSSWGHSTNKYITATKTALKKAIDNLTPNDTLTIQAFAEKGTEALWGSTKITDAEKLDAKKFVDGLERGYGSNLHEALLEAILRAKRNADDEEGTVTLLVLLSQSWASTGTTDRSKIVKDVWKLNHEGKVKMFSLASPGSDDELLQAIAITNGGKTVRIAEGTVDYAAQMDTFFESEFGNVLLSDVAVDFVGDASVYGETRRTFPLLAQGSEVIVRGLLPAALDTTFQVVTSAKTFNGEQSWTAVAQGNSISTSIGTPNSQCFQSYAHSRVAELMHYWSVAELLGDDVVEPIVTLSKPCNKDEGTFADCIKEDALDLALKAELVVPRLTGIVTTDNDKCLSYEEEAEICLDGTSKSYVWDDYGSAAQSDSPQSSIMLTLVLSLSGLLVGFVTSWC